jgi:hypothetical protein
MGILDDAIREHLDLKRRSGADPADVDRAEREALGPVRRGPEPEAEPPLEEDLEDEHGPAYEEPPADEWDEPVGHESEPHAEEAERDLPQMDEPEPFTAAFEAKPESHAARPAEPAGQETVEYEVELDEEEHQGEGELPGEEHRVEDQPHREARKGEGDDVLEETPEFLQDAPDHDRLWFEQRPPKDFDFDG